GIVHGAAVAREHLLDGQLGVEAFLNVAGDGIGEALILTAAGVTEATGSELTASFVGNVVQQRTPHRAAGRQRGAVLEDDVDGATDALAVDVRAGAAHDLDAIDEFRGNPVHQHRAIGGVFAAGIRHRFAVDQDLREPAAHAAQLRALV